MTDLVLDKKELAGILNQTEPDKQAAYKATKSKDLGVAMICGDKQGRYINMVEDLQNKFTKGNDNYPANTAEAYNPLKL